MSTGRLRRLFFALLLAGVFAGGCENVEEKTRYVKAPLDAADEDDPSSVNNAIRESKTRLTSIRSNRLRAEVSKDLDDDCQRLLAHAREAESRREARLALERDREAARKEREIARREREAAQKLRLVAEWQLSRNPAPRTASSRSPRASPVDSEYARARQAVKELQVGTRQSMLGDGTQVLVLRNAKPYRVDFDLRCFTRDDATKKTLYVAVPPRSEKHVGFMEGWCGNFTPGQRVEAWLEDELIWKYTIRDR